MPRLGLDEYARADSPLHRWEPRCKLVGLMALIFAFSYVQDLHLLPAMLAATALLYATSKMPISFLARRLRAPGIFLIIPVLLLPLYSGSTVFLHIGPLGLRQEGCLQAASLLTRFVSILTTGLLLFGTAPFLTSVKAMRALGLPSLLADMTLFSYRYIYVIGDDLGTMQTAMGLRGFRLRRPDGRALITLSSLAGSVLVRSYERSERVHKAMLLRGYGQASPRRWDSKVSIRDVIALAAVLFVAAGLVATELLLRGFGG